MLLFDVLVGVDGRGGALRKVNLRFLFCGES